MNTRSEPREPGVIYTHPEPWPDWRRADRDQLRASLNRPIEGVLFDVEYNSFWHESWGQRPQDTISARVTATGRLAQVPPMVPVYGHRYLPAGRGLSGHPVLSMWQTDIIYYGLNLADYIDREFGHRGPGEEPWKPQASVEFWRDLV